jgi:hypothetical protein
MWLRPTPTRLERRIQDCLARAQACRAEADRASSDRSRDYYLKGAAEWEARAERLAALRPTATPKPKAR